jgi:poly(3-hydroxybutyrate) depolymerase
MRCTLVLLSCALFIQGSLRAQPEIANKFVYRSHTHSGTTLPYRLFIPDAYSSSRHYPLVLVLHGAGERGTDNSIQITNTRIATCWADSTAQLTHPCFVVAPQCPQNGGWATGDPTSLIRPELATVIDILDSLAREFTIDTNRVYVTGFSMGGSGTWEIILRFPERFAAAVPMAGGTNPMYAYRCANVPIWDFHGTVDQLVPVQYSRVMMDSLRALGKPVVYTHCRNLDCTGLPDSTIAMQVGSHEELFYTEIKNAGHTYGIWGTSSNYPFLPTWMFDKYKKQPGAIGLSNLKSYTTLSGNARISWNSSTGDSVEIWFSPDAGTSWQPVANVPNSNSYVWNSSLVPDCAFGSFKLFLKNGDGFIIGSDHSSSFAVNNTQNGSPFVKLLNEEFTTGIVFAQDSLDLSFLAGDPTGTSLAASLLYSGDGGSTFEQFDFYTAVTNPLPQTRRIDIGSLANSNQAVLRLNVSNGKSAAVASSFPFAKITPRLQGTAVTRAAGSSAAKVTVHVVSPSALTGHRYQVKFDDTSSTQKQYMVLDVDRGATVIDHATELDGVKEGPLFDGIRLVIADVTVPQAIPDSTRWITGSATLKTNVRVPSGGKGNFNDYRITIFSTIVDTSKSGFGPDATPMKFLVWNLTKNRQADVVFYNSNGDNTIGPDVRVDILEPDSTGSLKVAWSLVFVGQAGDILPVPGDQFVLRTVKPLTSSDVYEFTGTVSSVRPGAVPLAFSLEQNYPNPFNPLTSIRFGLATSADVNLTVYDILGRRVAVLVNERKNAGSFEVKFDGSHLASGVYFYRLQVHSLDSGSRQGSRNGAGEYSQVRKLCLIR